MKCTTAINIDGVRGKIRCTRETKGKHLKHSATVKGFTVSYGQPLEVLVKWNAKSVNTAKGWYVPLN